MSTINTHFKDHRSVYSVLAWMLALTATIAGGAMIGVEILDAVRPTGSLF